MMSLGFQDVSLFERVQVGGVWMGGDEVCRAFLTLFHQETSFLAPKAWPWTQVLSGGFERLGDAVHYLPGVCFPVGLRGRMAVRLEGDGRTPNWFS